MAWVWRGMFAVACFAGGYVSSQVSSAAASRQEVSALTAALRVQIDAEHAVEQQQQQAYGQDRQLFERLLERVGKRGNNR